MIKNSKMRFVTGLWAVLCMALPLQVFAEISFYRLKGLSQQLNFKPEYEDLSPVVLFGMLRQGALNHELKYGDPKDPMISLGQQMFNAHSDSPQFLTISPLAKKVVRFIGPSTAGKMIQLLVDSDSNLSKEKLAQFKQQLKETILNDPEFKERVLLGEELAKEPIARMDAIKKDITADNERIKKVEQERAKVNKEKKALFPQGNPCKSSTDPSAGNLDSLAAQVKDFEERLAHYDDEVKKLREGLEQKKKHPELETASAKRDELLFKESYLEAFLDKVLGAWQAEKSNPNGHSKNYVEQLLACVALLNAKDDRTDLVRLYFQMPKLFKDPKTQAHLEFFARQKSWVDEAYTKADFDQVISHLQSLPLPKRAQYLLDNPEHATLATYGRGIWDPDFVPIYPFRTTAIKGPNNQVHTFANCVETSVLNFFASALSGQPSGVLSLEHLKKALLANGYSMDPRLEAFLQKYPTPAAQMDQKALQEFTEMISNVEGLEYEGPRGSSGKKFFELEGYKRNIIKLMGKFLFAQPPEKFAALSRKDQYKLIQDVFSRPGHQLTIRDDNLSEELGSLHFFVNNKHRFSWDIHRHSEIVPAQGGSTPDWQNGIADELSHVLREEDRRPARVIAAQWASGAEYGVRLLNNRAYAYDNEIVHKIIMGMPVETDSQKLDVISLIAANRIDSEKVYARDLIEKLTLDPENYGDLFAILSQYPQASIYNTDDLIKKLKAHSPEAIRRAAVWAASGRGEEAFKELAQHDPEAFYYTHQELGQNVLELAIRKGERPFLKYILDGGDFHKMDFVDEFGRSAIHLAAKYAPDEEFARIVSLSNSNDLRKVDSSGLTPLVYAILNGSAKKVETLTSGMATSELVPYLRGVFSEYGNEEIATLWAKRLSGEILYARDNNGYTPLETALSSGWNKPAEILLEKLPTAEILRSYQKSPVDFFGNPAAIRALAKADKSRLFDRVEGRGALHYALMAGCIECVKALLETVSYKDLRLNREDEFPFFATAFRNGNESLAKLLLEQLEPSDADAFIKKVIRFGDARGVTALRERFDDFSSRATKKSFLGKSFLQEAVKRKDPLVIREVLASLKPEDIKKRRVGIRGALKVGVEFGDIGIVESILGHLTPKEVASKRKEAAQAFWAVHHQGEEGMRVARKIALLLPTEDLLKKGPGGSTILHQIAADAGARGVIDDLETLLLRLRGAAKNRQKFQAILQVRDANGKNIEDVSYKDGQLLDAKLKIQDLFH